MSKVSIEPIGYALGARVTGIDLSQPIGEADFDLIHRGWLEHLVLVFPNQDLEPRSLVAFTERFGELDDFSNQVVHHDAEYQQVMKLTNRPQDGKPSKTYNAGQNWHTDQSYTVRPAKATAVYCIERPSVGGDTMFANMYLSLETLSPKLQEILHGLEGIHDASLIEGLDKRGPDVVTEFKRKNPPVVHPAVRLHPESGRHALYVNERVRRFVGMSETESRPLIRFLCEHAVTPRNVYRHSWSVRDLVIWDNRCLMHMAVGDYDPAEIRHMIRTSGRGEHFGRLAELQSPTPDEQSVAERKPHQLAAEVASLDD